MTVLLFNIVERYGADLVDALRRSGATWKEIASRTPLKSGHWPYEDRNGPLMMSISRGDAADRLEQALADNRQSEAIEAYRQGAVLLVADARRQADFMRKHGLGPDIEPDAGDSGPVKALKALLKHEDVLLAHSSEARDAVDAARKALMDAQVPVIDLVQVAMESFHEAARESKWMPPEYMANDWQSDVCTFLREGPSAFMPDSLANVAIFDPSRKLAYGKREREGDVPQFFVFDQGTQEILLPIVEGDEQNVRRCVAAANALRSVPMSVLVPFSNHGDIADIFERCKRDGGAVTIPEMVAEFARRDDAPFEIPPLYLGFKARDNDEIYSFEGDEPSLLLKLPKNSPWTGRLAVSVSLCRSVDLPTLEAAGSIEELAESMAEGMTP